MKMPGPHHIGIATSSTGLPLMLTFSCGEANVFDRKPAKPAQIVECPEHGEFIALIPIFFGVDPTKSLNVMGNPSPVILVSLDDIEFAQQWVNR